MMLVFNRSTAIKLEQYEINVLINGLYQHKACYENVSDFILRLVNKSEHMKPNRKKKILFQPGEPRVIRYCLLTRRNEQLQAQEEAAQAVGELLAKFL